MFYLLLYTLQVALTLLESVVLLVEGSSKAARVEGLL